MTNEICDRELSLEATRPRNTVQSNASGNSDFPAPDDSILDTRTGLKCWEV